MDINVDNYKDRITHKRKSVASRNNFGETIEENVILGIYWAYVKPLSANEIIRAGAVDAKYDYKIYIQYKSNLKEEDILVYKDEEYQIVGIVDINNERTEQEITAVKYRNV